MKSKSSHKPVLKLANHHHLKTVNRIAWAVTEIMRAINKPEAKPFRIRIQSLTQIVSIIVLRQKVKK